MNAAMKAAMLIQQINGLELPASGCWDILAGQSLTADRPWSRRSCRLSIVSGMLTVAEGQPAMDLTLRARSDARQPARLDYVGRLTSADRYGRWEFHGPATVGTSRIAELGLSATYLGVYTHGAAPVALLEVWLKTGGRARRVDIRGKLNLRRVLPEKRDRTGSVQFDADASKGLNEGIGAEHDLGGLQLRRQVPIGTGAGNLRT